MCYLTICVPTIATDNKGLPHTLEHLVLCGSESYPNRGSLDAIAGCNFSYGTCGCTNADHTFYTVTTAGEEAIANMLPVFLDHVLHPLLSDDQFVTEVYHFDADGKERGVVFSEEVATENSRFDLVEFALYKLMYSEKSPYSYNFGGLTKDIATLTNQEIIDYHRRFYDANNITVLLVGSFSDSFESVLQ
ncbi:LuxS/MPP-like metallohydrolase, partial [Linderina pennispora]